MTFRFARTLSSLLIAAAAVLTGTAILAPTPSSAAVMTFSGVNPGCGTSGINYTENGIVASIASANNNPGVLHLDDFHDFCPSSSTFTASNDEPFDAISARILPLDEGRTNYCADAGPNGERCNELRDNGEYDPYENVRWEGLVDGLVVASDEFYMGSSPFTYVFGETFRGIDALRVTALSGPFAGFSAGCWDFPCAHFEIDDVTLALTVIPVPAAGWLFLTALAGLGTLRRRA